MRDYVVAFVCGLLFAVGLAISGMTQPAKVTAFLDIAGSWDPSLAFVMAGAIGVYLPFYRRVTSRENPFFGPTFHLPTSTKVNSPLILGSALFGIGWGVGGFCPGPAFASLGTGGMEIMVFVLAMASGMLLFSSLDVRKARRSALEA